MPEYNFDQAKELITTTIGLEAIDESTLDRYLIEYAYSGVDLVPKYRPFIVIAKMLYLSPANNIKQGDGVTLEGNKDTALRYLSEQYRLDMMYNYQIPDDDEISATWAKRQILLITTDLEAAKKGQTPSAMAIVLGALF